MKKNFYYLSLMFGLFFGMTMFTACGGGDDGDDPVPVPPTPQPEEQDDMLKTPLTLEAIENGTITFWNAATGNVTYKIDGGVAQIIEAGTSKDIPVSAGQKVTLYGDNATYTNRSLPSNRHSKISSTAGFYVYGNIMSLISSTSFATATTLTGEGTFGELFSRTVKLRNHPSKQLLLPATTLAEDCYAEMFQGCTGLTTAPALPAMSVTGAGYCGMFDGCTSLTKAPELPATTVGKEGYAEMFSGCTSLTTAPALPATTLTDYCYSYMFEGCTALTTAPTLSATTLVQGCYQHMFEGCSNLNSVKCLATNVSADYCTMSWLKGVAASGTFVKASGMTGWTSGNSGIPTGWAVQ